VIEISSDDDDAESVAPPASLPVTAAASSLFRPQQQQQQQQQQLREIIDLVGDDDLPGRSEPVTHQPDMLMGGGGGGGGGGVESKALVRLSSDMAMAMAMNMDVDADVDRDDTWRASSSGVGRSSSSGYAALSLQNGRAPRQHSFAPDVMAGLEARERQQWEARSLEVDPRPVYVPQKKRVKAGEKAVRIGTVYQANVPLAPWTEEEEKDHRGPDHIGPAGHRLTDEELTADMMKIKFFQGYGDDPVRYDPEPRSRKKPVAEDDDDDDDDDDEAKAAGKRTKTKPKTKKKQISEETRRAREEAALVREVAEYEANYAAALPPVVQVLQRDTRFDDHVPTPTHPWPRIRNPLMRSRLHVASDEEGNRYDLVPSGTRRPGALKQEKYVP
jgi:hypothetical protein